MVVSNPSTWKYLHILDDFALGLELTEGPSVLPGEETKLQEGSN